MRRIIVGALFASILLGGFAQARPNLFDPVEEIGTLTFVDGIFSVNGMELELGSRMSFGICAVSESLWQDIEIIHLIVTIRCMLFLSMGSIIPIQRYMVLIHNSRKNLQKNNIPFILKVQKLDIKNKIGSLLGG